MKFQRVVSAVKTTDQDGIKTERQKGKGWPELL